LRGYSRTDLQKMLGHISEWRFPERRGPAAPDEPQLPDAAAMLHCILPPFHASSIHWSFLLRKKRVHILPSPNTRPNSLKAKKGIKATKVTRHPASNSWWPSERVNKNETLVVRN
jgi:hypothetical protein